jgi:hypothetical protein
MCTTQSDLIARITATGAKDASDSDDASAFPTVILNLRIVYNRTQFLFLQATTASTARKGPKATTATTSTSITTAAKATSTDIQLSLTLDPSVISTGFENDGQNVPVAGQVASLTSRNNFINFCATVPNLPLTNGKQIAGGSCNTAPMGIIPSKSKMPSSKFTFPRNGAKIPANQNFTIKMAIRNLETGNFVNAEENYYSAPQQVNKQGVIVGHSHVVVEKLAAIDQITLTDPSQFAFFKGLNEAAVNGVLSADVHGGLPAGFYKLSSINSASNHQPVLAPVAQHGSLDDVVYVCFWLCLCDTYFANCARLVQFTVTNDASPTTTATSSTKTHKAIATSASTLTPY